MTLIPERRLFARSVCLFFTPAEAPEDEAQAAVGVQADGHLPRRVQLALQLDGAAEGTGGCVRHLNETRTSFIASD